MSALDERLGRELAHLRAVDLYRIRRVVDGGHGVDLIVDGRRCVNFCSNDYLGLAADPRLAEAAAATLRRSGTGSGAAALVSGYNDEHAQLEAELAEFLGRPRALLFSSGWAANLGVMRALLGRDDVIVADELNHASLIDGGRLSGARYHRVAHGRIDAFAAALDADAAAGSDDRCTALVVTDAVFSMDGDLAPLPALARLCATRRASLMLDDAHGFGVLGTTGRGTVEHSVATAESAFAEPDIYVATLGKSLGAAGAFVAGSEALIEYLIQRARTWVFSTAPPPAIAAAARAALRILQSEPERRVRLFANIQRFRDGAGQLGISLPAAPTLTPIIPLIIGDAAQALALSRALQARGFWVAAIRPPTVPPGTSRLRITLSAAHSEAQIDGLLEALAVSLAVIPRAA